MALPINLPRVGDYVRHYADAMPRKEALILNHIRITHGEPQERVDGLAAVLGVPNPVYHEVGYAFVQPEPSRTVNQDQLQAWCRERLANYKIPKQITVMAELPRLPIGKIDKQALKRSLGGQ